MKTQDVITYILVAGAVAFLMFKFLKPLIKRKSREAKLAVASETSSKKVNPEKNGAGCYNDCNCK